MLTIREARSARSGQYALVPPLDRGTLEAALILIAIPMIGGALLAASATTAGVVVLSAAVVGAILWTMRDRRTRF